MAKRRLRIFPILSIIIVIAVVIWAINIVVDIFGEKPEENIDNDTNIEENQVDVQVPDEETAAPDLPVEPEAPVEPETPVEVAPDFTTDAPKPLFTQNELVEMYPSSTLSKTEDAGQDYIDSMVFIGDSTTHGMAYYGVLDGGKETNQVWTPRSGTLAMWNLLTENIVYPEDDSEMLIADAVAIKKPAIVVMTLGVNGVSSLSEDQFVGYYQGLIDAVKKASPDTKIILQSIYPVCDYYEYVNSISMEKINRANTWIAKLADDNEVYYLNTISSLLSENGHLKEEYCNGDGIHISREGFNVILDFIRTHAIDE